LQRLDGAAANDEVEPIHEMLRLEELACLKLDDRADDAEHETSSEAGLEDVSSSNCSNSPSSSEKNLAAEQSEAMMPAEVQRLVGVDLASPWTPLWSILENASATPVLNGGISLEETVPQTKHFEWCTLDRDDDDKPKCVQGLQPLDLDSLTGGLEFDAVLQVKQSSPSCSSTCSYSSSEDGSCDESEHNFIRDPSPERSQDAESMKSSSM